MNLEKDNFFHRTYLKPLFFDFQCPECGHSYRVDTKDLISKRPHFECVTCACEFVAEVDPQSPRHVITRSARSQAISRLTGKKPIASMSRICPKCQAINLKSAKECSRCGLIFSQWELSQKEGGVFPSLIKAWQDLLQDYNNLTKHLEFVQRCEELQAIPYALKKYEELRATQPFDQMAQEMHKHVLLKSMAKHLPPPPPLLVGWWRQLASLPWAQYFNILSWLLPFVFIVFAFIKPAWRNLAGLGVSWLFVRVITYMWFRKDK